MTSKRHLGVKEVDDDPGPHDPAFWRGYRVRRVGGTVYLENEAGVEAFTPEMAEAYALAIIAEIHGGKPVDRKEGS